MIRAAQLARWRKDPVAFVTEALRNPDDNGRPFTLYPGQAEFLREALRRGPDGKLLHPEILASLPKKSGKSMKNAWVTLYAIIVLGGKYAEGYVCSNDLQQSQDRVFTACVRLIESSPLLKDSARITADCIYFPASQSRIIPLAADWRGSAGANPTIISFDEIWGYDRESANRLFDEMVISPTRKISMRIITSYGGFEGESILLESLLKRGFEGRTIPGTDLYEQPGMLMWHSHEPVAPWQTDAWKEQMRATLRPSAYLRQIENRFASGESDFVPLEWFDQCVHAELTPIAAAPSLPVWVGVDASTKHDYSAIAVCTWDPRQKKVRLVAHKIWKPTPETPLDFELCIEDELVKLARRFAIRKIFYDPWQMVAVGQRLANAKFPIEEFTQTIGNLTEMSTNLYDLLKSRNILLYPDAEIRLSISHAIALETARGWRITKQKASHKIDIVVALGMAALAAMRAGYTASKRPPRIAGMLENGQWIDSRMTREQLDTIIMRTQVWPNILRNRY